MIHLPPDPERGYPILDWAKRAQRMLSQLRPVAGPGISIKEGTTGFVVECTARPGTAEETTFVPWDEFSKVGVGTPGEDGLYASYEWKLWPGSFGSIVPDNMFEVRTVSATGTFYLIVTGTGSAGAMDSATLSVSGTHPAGQVETLGAPPASVAHVVGVFVDGEYFNVAGKNLTVTPKETFRETDPDANPYGLPYRSYFVWFVQ